MVEEFRKKNFRILELKRILDIPDMNIKGYTGGNIKINISGSMLSAVIYKIRKHSDFWELELIMKYGEWSIRFIDFTNGKLKDISVGRTVFYSMDLDIEYRISRTGATPIVGWKVYKNKILFPNREKMSN